jgi:hypothetical protein
MRWSAAVISPEVPKTIECFDAALRVFTDHGFPQEHEQVANSLQTARAKPSDDKPTN